MIAPLPLQFWEALRYQAEPFELMKFTLIFDGDLPSAGNKTQPIPASIIRNEFHHQLADLWESHIILRHLASVRTTPGAATFQIERYPLPEADELKPKLAQALDPSLISYCAPIHVPEVGVNFIPLVRQSLYLACSVDVLFLRHEEPYNLMRHGGDLDGRIKTLFDALKMPQPGNEYRGTTPTADPLYVVLQDDALISDLSVRSGRLLGNRTKDKHAVRLTVDITVKVLRVFSGNQGLLGA